MTTNLRQPSQPAVRWAPIPSATGIPEVTVEWVAAHRDEVRMIDVREPHELVTDGRVAGIESIPLGRFPGIMADAPRDQRIVIVGRSGARSGHAARALETLGFRAVASMRGGMIAWGERRFRIVR